MNTYKKISQQGWKAGKHYKKDSSRKVRSKLKAESRKLVGTQNIFKDEEYQIRHELLEERYQAENWDIGMLEVKAGCPKSKRFKFRRKALKGKIARLESRINSLEAAGGSWTVELLRSYRAQLVLKKAELIEIEKL